LLKSLRLFGRLGDELDNNWEVIDENNFNVANFKICYKNILATRKATY
jgi:hypothetical protein